MLFTAQIDAELVSDGAARCKIMPGSFFTQLHCKIFVFIPVKIESPHFAVESGQL